MSSFVVIAAAACRVRSREYLPVSASIAANVAYTEDERDIILSHGPWPPDGVPNRSNRVSGNPDAIALGQRLFSDPRLSTSNTVSCATCHEQAKAFTDGRRLGQGLAPLDRNSPSIWNARFNCWFGWAGAVDTLWGASVRPILAASEMRATAGHAAQLAATEPNLAALFEKEFGAKPGALNSEDTLVALGKALATFQETLVTGRTAFDQFRDGLAKGDAAAISRYPANAQRGLKIFIGKGQCSICHFSPGFTNGEFDDVGIPFFTGPGKVDKGRYEGIKLFRQSPYSGFGHNSDDRDGAGAVLTRQVALQHRNWGEFKVPSLRNVALTAPYMHNGSLKTLRDVVIHYSDINSACIPMAPPS